MGTFHFVLILTIRYILWLFTRRKIQVLSDAERPPL